MRVDTLVLDLGGVLVDWQPRLAYPELSLADYDAAMARIGFAALNLRADAGERWEDLVAEVKRTSVPDAALLAQYPARFALTVPGPVPGMVALVQDVLAAGVTVLGLTNWSAQTYPHGVAAVPVIASLHGVVVSGEEGVVKPDPAIFRILLTRYALDPARVLFVDDRAENVAAAVELGMAGHVFTGERALRADLTDRGLLSPG